MLEEEISTIQKSQNTVDINQPECPFCSGPQPFIPGVGSSENGLRIRCDCMQMQEYLKQNRKLNELKEAGKLRIEGKDYVVQDGDVMFFKFNV